MEASHATDPLQARGAQLTLMDVHDFNQSYPQKKLMTLWSSTARDWRRFSDRRVQVYIYAHFELFKDINVLRSLELNMEECGRAITEYFRGKPTNKEVKDILSNGENNEMALRVVQLLMAHFGEELTGLILLTDVLQKPTSFASTAGETTLRLPASPRLILPGATGQVTIKVWMITFEGRVISEGITPTFATGFAAMFAIYYIFNLQYQDEAACTLEFIQR
ncbi:uncharacterized protein LOC109088557 [Tachysurus ichikawai]